MKFKYPLIIILSIFLIPAFLFFLSESNRESLIKSYAIPMSMLEKLRVTSKTKIAELIAEDEILVCWMLPYHGVDQLKYELNSSQKLALLSTELPSEDLTWYLLIFSKTHLSRVNLISQHTQIELEPSDRHCFSKIDSYQARISNASTKLFFYK